jgi:hypothetical protein
MTPFGGSLMIKSQVKGLTELSQSPYDLPGPMGQKWAGLLITLGVQAQPKNPRGIDRPGQTIDSLTTKRSKPAL